MLGLIHIQLYDPGMEQEMAEMVAATHAYATQKNNVGTLLLWRRLNNELARYPHFFGLLV